MIWNQEEIEAGDGNESKLASDDPPPPVLLDVDFCGGIVNLHALNPPKGEAAAVDRLPPLIYVEFARIPPAEIFTLGLQDSEIAASDFVEFINLRDFLVAQGLTRAEQSFQSSLEFSPDRARFYTFHFQPDRNVALITTALNERSIVARAVAGRNLVPPQPVLDPLQEPLVGSLLTTSPSGIKGLENQWYLFRCGVDRVWKRGFSGKGVVIADIDWGFNINHLDLKDQIDVKFNSMDQGSNVSSSNVTCHGTAVFGIAGAANNNYGMAGVAYDSRLWAIMAGDEPLATINAQPWWDALDFVRCTDSHGARKIVMLEVQTLAGENIEVIPQISQAITDAIKAEVVVCVAAGNGQRDAGSDEKGNPFPPTGSIIVGATAYDSVDNPLADFSNFGPRVAIYAPGDRRHDLTCGSLTKNAYRNNFGGTSGATPKVAGTIALMLEANSKLTHCEIKDILRETGTPIKTDNPNAAGGVFLNAERAVCEAINRAGGKC